MFKEYNSLVNTKSTWTSTMVSQTDTLAASKLVVMRWLVSRHWTLVFELSARRWPDASGHIETTKGTHWKVWTITFLENMRHPWASTELLRTDWKPRLKKSNLVWKTSENYHFLCYLYCLQHFLTPIGNVIFLYPHMCLQDVTRESILRAMR